ncbi:hypothetical protein L195_g003614 [Trifolium pratense]|uniref:Uncharacterized protein n=1 Tax=Trifolium pratense TaxID=57577 RepID=A0A2K3NVR7_TRIPR|nr:hypothetical protein L195_g003614 [Trifolium pratense]
MGVLLKICLVLETDVVFLHGGNLSLLVFGCANPSEASDLDSGCSEAHLYHVDETSSAISKDVRTT